MKRRAEGGGGSSEAPINRASTEWSCTAPALSACTPREGGAFSSRAACEAHPLCAPPNPAGAADRDAQLQRVREDAARSQRASEAAARAQLAVAARGQLVVAAREQLAPIDAAIRAGEFRLGLTSNGGLVVADGTSMRADRTAWFFAKAIDPPMPPEYLGHHMFYTAPVDCCVSAPGLLLLMEPELGARLRQVEKPWPVTADSAAELTRAGLAVAFTHTLALPPGRSLAHITVPLATMKCTVWGMQDSRALLVLG